MIASPEFKETIFKAVCACVGVSASSSEAKALIREAYLEPENSPRPARNENVIYWYMMTTDEIPDTIAYENVPTDTGKNSAITFSNTPHELHFICYGPSCYSYAIMIRLGMFVDGYKNPRSLFRAAGVYPVPNPPQPAYSFEPEGSLWRCRADVRIPFICEGSQIIGNARNAIRSAPGVIIRH